MDERALHRTARDRAGILRTRDLLTCGFTARQITAEVHHGWLLPIRSGWFALTTARPDVIAAVRHHATLTCVSALQVHGIWTPPHHELHVRQRRPSDQPTLPDGMLRCTRSTLCTADTPVDSVAISWRHAVRCLPLDEAVAVTDSALRLGGLAPEELATLPNRLAGIARLADPRAESGTESLVRVRLRRCHVRVEPQVIIPRVGRVDLLVGDRLVLECDSRAHHTDRPAYTNDRRRDRELILAGYTPFRLTWEDVTFHWDSVEPQILALVRRDRHRRR